MNQTASSYMAFLGALLTYSLTCTMKATASHRLALMYASVLACIWANQNANRACHGRSQYFQSVWTKSRTIGWLILILKLKLGNLCLQLFVRFHGLDFLSLWAVRAGLAGHPWHSHHGACAVQRHPCAEAHPHTDGSPKPCGVAATRGSVTQKNRCHRVMAWMLEQGVHRRCCIDS